MKAVDTILLVVQCFIRLTEFSSALYKGAHSSRNAPLRLSVCPSKCMVGVYIVSLINERMLYENVLGYLSLDDKNARIHD